MIQPSARLRREWMLLALGVLIVLASRVPFLAPTLEDLDSVNFDLGVHDFDPYEYRPHPPGYAVFIGLAKVAHPLFDSHATGMALISALMSAVAVVPLYLLARRLTGPVAAGLVTLFVLFNPVVWINGVRPMSDLTGFAAIVSAQCLLVVALLASDEDPWRRWLWYAGVAAAALSVGVRLQAIVLVGPILAIGWIRMPGVRVLSPIVFIAVMGAWLTPTLVESGGADRFWEKQLQVIAEAWPSEPLVADWSEARAWRSLSEVLLLPWGHPVLGAVFVGLAVAGLLLISIRNGWHAALVLVLFAPYALYHLLLQETDMVRYAIPLLPFTALPAAAAIERLGHVRGYAVPAAAGAFAVTTVVLTGPSLTAYGGDASPPARAVAYLEDQTNAGAPIVVAGNHVYARYVQALPPPARVLAIPSWRESREMNAYWLAGGTDPVWFLRSPERRSLDLIDPAAQTLTADWEWPEPLQRLLSGSRPVRVELLRIDRPRWFVASGYAASGEAGSFEAVGHEPHLIYVRGDLDELMVITARARGAGPVTAKLADRAAGAWDVSGTFAVPLRIAPGAGRTEYIPLQLETGPPLELIQVAAVAPNRDLLNPLRGLFDREPDELGEPYRWMARDAALLAVRSGGPLRLTIRGRLPVQYYDVPPREVRVTVGGGEPVDHTIDADRFTLEFDIPETTPGDVTDIALHVSAGFIPHDTLGNGDMRELSLMIYDMSLEPR